MARVNDHYLALKSSYLFSEIARRIKAFQAAHPDAKLIRLGIGDVTRPLPPVVVDAMHAAVDEMARVDAGSATCGSGAGARLREQATKASATNAVRTSERLMPLSIG